MSTLTDRLRYLSELSSDSCFDDMPCCIEELDKSAKVIDKQTEALEKLSRLGNEPLLGNSDGNIIAQKALQDD